MMLYACTSTYKSKPLWLNLDHMESLQSDGKGGSTITFVGSVEDSYYDIEQTPAEVLDFIKGNRP